MRSTGDAQFWPTGSTQHTPGREVQTPADCLRRGGHCWQDVSSFMQGNGVTFVGQSCKHCTATRSGRSRDPYEWTYPEDQA